MKNLRNAAATMLVALLLTMTVPLAIMASSPQGTEGVATTPQALPAVTPAPATPASPPIEEGTIAAILSTGLFGLPVSGLTELLKRAVKKYLKVPDKPWLGYLVSLAVTIPSVWLYLSKLGAASSQNIITATAVCWAVANGFYKITVKAGAEKAQAAMAAELAKYLPR